MKIRILFALALLALASIGFAVYAQRSRSCTEKDFDAYNRIEQVKGKVTILNHPTLGKTAGSGVYLVFRREGCEDCLIGTNTDGDGNYKILVGVGKYKIIVQDPRCEVSGEGCNCQNMLAADQPEFIDVKKGRAYDSEFNINLSLTK